MTGQFLYRMMRRLEPMRAAVARLRADREGSVAIIFASVLIPLIALVGAAVDYSQALRLKDRLQAALDATALAVSRDGTEMSDAEIGDLANSYFAAHLRPGEIDRIGELALSRAGTTVNLAINGVSPTSFISILGVKTIPVAALSEVLLDNQTFEIALVLDNSGSMAGSRIISLRDAATTLIDTLYGDVAYNPNLTFALVPFTSAVNVGTQNKHASWMDANGQSPLHHLEFENTSLTRYQLYDRISNVEWPGCVESRAYPMDVNDTPANPANPETLFVPYFAPDEPDSSSYWNSYLPDGMSGSNWAARQKRLAKYAPGVTAGVSQIGASYGIGPAFLCNSQPIQALTDNKTAIKNAIAGMQALGGTNITEGLVWGWRTLSPGEPFTEGRPYDEITNKKIIILLTDGENDWASMNNHNRSYYFPYGYLTHGRLGITSGTKAQIVARMNDRLREACNNVRARGLRVYSIVFGSVDATTTQLMRDCATSPALYFHAPTTDEIRTTFEAIAADISNLRIIK